MPCRFTSLGHVFMILSIREERDKPVTDVILFHCDALHLADYRARPPEFIPSPVNADFRHGTTAWFLLRMVFDLALSLSKRHGVHIIAPLESGRAFRQLLKESLIRLVNPIEQVKQCP